MTSFTTQPIIRFAKQNDMEAIIVLCELHAEYEQAEYNMYQKSLNLTQYLFSNPPSLYCLVVEHNGEFIGYATYMTQFSTWDVNFYIELV